MTVVADLGDVTPPLVWEPIRGAETEGFLRRKNASDGIPESALDRVVFEAQQILGRCVNPASPPDGATGLVVGYVQSGKTMSFITLSALAHDNGFGLIVLIAGTLENLLGQTRQRIDVDLELSAQGKTRPWMLVDRPKPGSADSAILKQHLTTWMDPLFPKNKKRVSVVIVLKHHVRLAGLRECLGGVDLSRVPTLIIDDEADQASLNTFAAKNLVTGSSRRSTNYKEVTDLKKLFPHHSYVQYTATPQANLLIALNDSLSPEFAELVTPGDGYVGGATLFKAHGKFAVTIPDADAAATLASSKGPPQTLVKALRIFLLGACAAVVLDSKSNRTMMVHPSQQTGPHSDYLAWLHDLIDGWKVLAASDSHEFFIKDFQDAYEDLRQTVGAELPPFASLAAQLVVVLQLVNVREVNSTGAGYSAINWSACDYWILIGGAKLDRGFTVEGLTVTYMPRPLAGGNADSLQQRARFYGYKQKYLGYCRVFLKSDVRHAFEQYVEHEADIHTSLKKTKGAPLKAWVRQFTLDSSMQPTRKGVIGIPVKDARVKGWIEPRAAHTNAAFVTANAALFNSFTAEIGLGIQGKKAQDVDSGRFIDRRSNSPSNLIYEGVSLELVVTSLLQKLKLGSENDAFELAAAILVLRKLIELGERMADVFLIGELQPQTRSKDGNQINQVAQGKSPAGTNDRSKLTYGGDRDFFSVDRVTVHLRRFNLKNAEGVVSESNIPWFALHIPDKFAKRYILQSEA
jgi:hypothetical protein